jgi:LysR family cyn operon transcriptional activator
MDRNPVFPRSIRYLIAVAEHASFTKAAEVLYVSQPTLSQQIKQLEDLLDVQLLDRSGRGVRLTDAGEIYLTHARRALGELDAAHRAIHELQDLSRGFLRLGMTPVTDYLTTRLLLGFIGRFPGISVRILEMPQDGIATALAEDRIDVGIAYNSALDSEKCLDDIDTQTLCVERLCLAVGCGHPLADLDGPLDSVEVLRREPLVMLNPDYALRRQVDVFCAEHGIKPSIALEGTSLGLITEVVRLGRFATILPDTICSSQTGMIEVKLVPELPHHATSLIFRKGAYRSPACKAFSELAGEFTSGRCAAVRGTS